ncbi:MAG: hypothetical protein AUK54_03365 [Helicobacteraceae bacterium CG2_30_36_10]|nr:MAG: hypothetical protein AUK54_03365 [Helicobacteraceae bacterium CG2_30_36_10]
MAKAHFIFTQHANSFSVYIKNLEQLSVEQIQQIENFVKNRNGLFDFNTYSFVIKKKIEFHEFVSLLWHVEIDSICEEKVLFAETKARIDFGKYKGMQYNEVPDAYLIWLKSNYRGKDRTIIDNELKNRSL